MCGTFLYTAPEVRRGESYGYAVDIWALGVLVYACLSGEMPACSSCSNCPNVSLDGLSCLVDDCSCPHSLSRDAESFLLCLLRPGALVVAQTCSNVFSVKFSVPPG